MAPSDGETASRQCNPFLAGAHPAKYLQQRSIDDKRRERNPRASRLRTRDQHQPQHAADIPRYVRSVARGGVKSTGESRKQRKIPRSFLCEKIPFHSPVGINAVEGEPNGDQAHDHRQAAGEVDQPHQLLVRNFA